MASFRLKSGGYPDLGLKRPRGNAAELAAYPATRLASLIREQIRRAPTGRCLSDAGTRELAPRASRRHIGQSRSLCSHCVAYGVNNHGRWRTSAESRDIPNPSALNGIVRQRTLAESRRPIESGSFWKSVDTPSYAAFSTVRIVPWLTPRTPAMCRSDRPDSRIYTGLIEEKERRSQLFLSFGSPRV